MLERVERESRRMDDLIEQLLTLARAQARQGDSDFASVDVVELLAQPVQRVFGGGAHLSFPGP